MQDKKGKETVASVWIKSEYSTVGESGGSSWQSNILLLRGCIVRRGKSSIWRQRPWIECRYAIDRERIGKARRQTERRKGEKVAEGRKVVEGCWPACYPAPSSLDLYTQLGAAVRNATRNACVTHPVARAYTRAPRKIEFDVDDARASLISFFPSLRASRVCYTS